MKTYRFLAHNQTGQIECVVAAKSMAEVARIMGEKDSRRLFNLAETRNEVAIAMTTAVPGRVFWRSIRAKHGDPWIAGDPRQGGKSGREDQ